MIDILILFFFCGVYVGCYVGDDRVVIFGGIDLVGNRFGDIWFLDIFEVLLIWQEVVIFILFFVWLGYILIWIVGRKMIFFGGCGIYFEVLNDVWLFDMEGDCVYWVELWFCEF